MGDVDESVGIGEHGREGERSRNGRAGITAIKMLSDEVRRRGTRAVDNDEHGLKQLVSVEQKRSEEEKGSDKGRKKA